MFILLNTKIYLIVKFDRNLSCSLHLHFAIIRADGPVLGCYSLHKFLIEIIFTFHLFSEVENICVAQLRNNKTTIKCLWSIYIMPSNNSLSVLCLRPQTLESDFSKFLILALSLPIHVIWSKIFNLSESQVHNL